MPKIRMHIVVVICLCISRVRTESENSEVSAARAKNKQHVIVCILCHRRRSHISASATTLCVRVNSPTHTNQPGSWKSRTKRKWDDANDDDVDGDANHIVSTNERRMDMIFSVLFFGWNRFERANVKNRLSLAQSGNAFVENCTVDFYLFFPVFNSNSSAIQLGHFRFFSPFYPAREWREAFYYGVTSGAKNKRMKKSFLFARTTQ